MLNLNLIRFYATSIFINHDAFLSLIHLNHLSRRKNFYFKDISYLLILLLLERKNFLTLCIYRTEVKGSG
jgi:hypothetical protein